MYDVDESIVIDESRKSVASELMRDVYLWMTVGIALTGVVAWLVAGSPALLSVIFGSKLMFYGIFVVELILVIILSAALDNLSFLAAEIMYTVYCALNGLTLSVLFMAYELSSVGQVFFVTAGAFALLALYGTFTKRDLSGWGTFLLMALGGMIIASLVGLLLGRPESILMSIIGVVIFAGLTAYDANTIRTMMLNQDSVNEGNMKLALRGALALYLDFINLFLRLLSLMGNKK